MSSQPVPAPDAASPWRRLIASVLDAVVVLGGIGALFGIGVVLYRKLPWARRRLRDARMTTRFTESMRRGDEPRLPRLWRRGIWVVSVATAVLGRNWRGPGARIMRIRRVDARTSGPVTVGSALIWLAADQFWSQVNMRLIAPRRRRRDNPLSSCLWLLPGVAAPRLPVLWSRRRQTVYDWLSTTAVVRDK